MDEKYRELERALREGDLTVVERFHAIARERWEWRRPWGEFPVETRVGGYRIVTDRRIGLGAPFFYVLTVENSALGVEKTYDDSPFFPELALAEHLIVCASCERGSPPERLLIAQLVEAHEKRKREDELARWRAEEQARRDAETKAPKAPKKRKRKRRRK